MEGIDKLLAYFGGGTIVVIGIVSWISKLIFEKTITKHSHQNSIELEKIKTELKIYSHESATSISKYNEETAKNLERLHVTLVELEYFVYQQLENTWSKWSRTTSVSQERKKDKVQVELEKLPVEELKERVLTIFPRDDKSKSTIEKSEGLSGNDLDLMSKDELINILQEYLNNINKIAALESEKAFYVGTLEFIGYQSPVWNKQFFEIQKKIKIMQIFLPKDVFESALKVVKNSQRTLNKSIQKIAKAALEFDVNASDNEVRGKVEEIFHVLHDEIHQEVIPLRNKISKEIALNLEPSRGQA